MEDTRGLILIYVENYVGNTAKSGRFKHHKRSFIWTDYGFIVFGVPEKIATQLISQQIIHDEKNFGQTNLFHTPTGFRQAESTSVKVITISVS
jgi:hypothetical protein